MRALVLAFLSALIVAVAISVLQESIPRAVERYLKRFDLGKAHARASSHRRSSSPTFATVFFSFFLSMSAPTTGTTSTLCLSKLRGGALR